MVGAADGIVVVNHPPAVPVGGFGVFLVGGAGAVDEGGAGGTDAEGNLPGSAADAVDVCALVARWKYVDGDGEDTGVNLELKRMTRAS